MSTEIDTPRDVADIYIARRLAEDPNVSANQIARELRAQGIGVRRQWVLQEVRAFAEEFGLTERSTHAVTHKFAPLPTAKRADALDVVSIARRNDLSLDAARQAFNRTHPDHPISMNAIRRHAGPALEKQGGTWRAKPRDRLARTMQVVTTEGVKVLTVKDSRTASTIGGYMAAVQRYQETRDPNVLRRFQGKSFRVEKRAYRFETDPDRLDELEVAGELDAIETVSG